MLTVLFWNLMGNHVESWPSREQRLRVALGRMATEYEVDLFVFAESAFDPADLLATLNRRRTNRYELPDNPVHKIQVFSRLPGGSVQSQFDSEDDRLTIRRVRTPRTEVLLAGLHSPSPLHWRPESQSLYAPRLRDAIVRTEDAVGHTRTVVVGDFNLSPFEAGLVGAFSAVMTKELASRGDRTVSGRPERFFYNPMWGMFGDRTAGPPGSYFKHESEPVAYYWGIPDQVLVRPALMDRLTEVRIVDFDGQESLVTDLFRPRKADLSDHLPVLVKFRV
jgi:hypothetical protein